METDSYADWNIIQLKLEKSGWEDSVGGCLLDDLLGEVPMPDCRHDLLLLLVPPLNLLIHEHQTGIVPPISASISLKQISVRADAEVCLYAVISPT